MPPRYAFRLEDLRVFHHVRASCHACGHKAIIANAALLQGRPGYTRLMSLERQLRCPVLGLSLEVRPKQGPVAGAILPPGPSPASGSLLTRCWRELDSNHRFR
jgi:hypothetical protein